MAFTTEQHETFDSYIMDLVKSAEFADRSYRSMAQELLAMEEDGEQVFINHETGSLYDERSMRGHISKFVKNSASNAFANDVKKNLMQEAYKASKDVADKPQMLKVLADKFMPDKKDETDADKNSPRIIAILDRGRMEITDGRRTITITEGTGDQGHERPDTVHPLADGRGEDTSIKTVSFTDDPIVRGLYKGEDTSEGTSVPDTKVPSKDAIDNDGGGCLGSPE